MELGFLAFLGGLILIFVFIVSCVVSLQKVSSEDLAEEYLRAGLQKLKLRLEEHLQKVEERESELKRKLAQVEALERVVAQKLEVPADGYLLRREDLKDAV